LKGEAEGSKANAQRATLNEKAKSKDRTPNPESFRELAAQQAVESKARLATVYPAWRAIMVAYLRLVSPLYALAVF